MVAGVDALAQVERIPGWLRPEDAEKLYELSYATNGPLLEIGTYRGKSTVLMAKAIKDAGHKTVLYTIDVDRTAQQAGAAEAQTHAVADVIVFIRGTVAAFARAYPHARPSLTFVDGDHTRAGVDRDLAVLEHLVPTNGLLLFHDFHDPRDLDLSSDELRVRPAVESSWVGRQCEFNGVFGCCGLFTRRDAPALRGSAIADLSRLDGIRDQYLHRLRYPAGRIWKQTRGRQ
jgi:predicted O-methyltransferase YrrM